MATATLETLRPAAAPGQHAAHLEYCGPARVTAVAGHGVELETPAGELHWARLAIAGVYAPRAGDLVLALATTGACYVVGVLEGHGTTVLNAPGDLELRAPAGEIRLVAGQGCAITAPNLRVRAREIDLTGETLREEFETVRRRITGAIEVRARAISTTVGETYRLLARRITGTGGETISLDAPAIDIG